MARLSSDPVTDSDLSKYLESSDFQLELDIFKSVSSRDIQSSHGGTYADPVTKKDRQYDIRAQINHGACDLKLAIECKNLKENFPLLISCVPRNDAESFHEVILGRTNSFPVQSGNIYRKYHATFKRGQPVGKSMAQVGKTVPEGRQGESQITSSDAETYEKWAQAVASAHDLVTSSGHSSLNGKGSNAAVICPVLVLPDDMLWAAHYSANGTLKTLPHKVEQCSLFLGKTIQSKWIGYTVSHLMMFTKSAFDSYLDNLADSNSEIWENLFPENSLLLRYERDGSLH